MYIQVGIRIHAVNHMSFGDNMLPFLASEMARVYHVAIPINGNITQNYSTTYLLRIISQ